MDQSLNNIKNKEPDHLAWISVNANLLHSNLDGSNIDGSFTMANANSFLSTYQILLIAQENKYLR